MIDTLAHADHLTAMIGSPAPYFRVESGDDKELTLDMIKGKVAAIFYENKDIVNANKRRKDELNKLYSEQTDALKDVLVRLPIIDCADAFWPFRGIWKRRPREHSKKEGMTICENGKPTSGAPASTNPQDGMCVNRYA